jgi:hypothetical protein
MSHAQTDFNWILAIIDSSNNDFHFSCIDRLIELFYEKHAIEAMRDMLVEVRYKHWNHIHSILK